MFHTAQKFAITGFVSALSFVAGCGGDANSPTRHEATASLSPKNLVNTWTRVEPSLPASDIKTMVFEASPTSPETLKVTVRTGEGREYPGATFKFSDGATGLTRRGEIVMGSQSTPVEVTLSEDCRTLTVKEINRPDSIARFSSDGKSCGVAAATPTATPAATRSATPTATATPRRVLNYQTIGTSSCSSRSAVPAPSGSGSCSGASFALDGALFELAPTTGAWRGNAGCEIRYNYSTPSCASNSFVFHVTCADGCAFDATGTIQ